MFSLGKKEKYFLYVLIFCLLFLFIPQQKVLGEKDNMNNEKLYQWLNQINESQAIKSLSTQVINNELKLITYLISKNNYGYVLMNNSSEILEYGEGREIPYQTNLVINTAIQKNKLTNLMYFSSIENYWKLNTTMGQIFIEGSSGEWLLDLSNASNKKFNSIKINLNDEIRDYYLNKTLEFDPYNDFFWLVDNKSPILTEDELIYLLKNNQKIIFTGKKYDNQADFAYSIIGYRSFGDKLFIATYDFLLDTIRFISYEELKHYGNFSIYYN